MEFNLILDQEEKMIAKPYSLVLATMFSGITIKLDADKELR
jgi:hypothetical protein